MNYFVSRNGQQFGPYTDDTVKSYLAAGSLLASDYIREETGASWTTIGQLFQAAPAIAPVAQPYPVAQTQPYVVPQGQPYAMAQGTAIVPPNLHWAIVLILGITWIFPIIWTFVQANFAKKIDETNKSAMQLGLWLLLSVGVGVMDYMIGTGSGGNINVFIPFCAMILAGILYLMGIFGIRRSMLNYYNSVEPIQLQLSGVMTFFFGILYLQYHMSRIARWKKTGVLS